LPWRQGSGSFGSKAATQLVALKSDWSLTADKRSGSERVDEQLGRLIDECETTLREKDAQAGELIAVNFYRVLTSTKKRWFLQTCRQLEQLPVRSPPRFPGTRYA
jgi:hypothetical protein